jgi:hypothetical protein
MTRPTDGRTNGGLSLKRGGCGAFHIGLIVSVSVHLTTLAVRRMEDYLSPKVEMEVGQPHRSILLLLPTLA